MSENPNPNPDPDPTPNPELEPDDAAELASLVVDDGKGGKMVPLAKMLEYKRQAKEFGKRVKELEPTAAEAAAIRERLDAAQPLISALVADPRLRAEALRITQGRTVAPAPQDDQEAKDYAEDMGIYLADGVTPDAVKGRRILDRENARLTRLTERVMGPMAGLVLNDKAGANIREAKAMMGTDGAPLASAESIDEVVAMMGREGAQLLADPRVVEILVNNAIGVDRRKGRTPKPIDEPLYLDSPHGRRRASEPVYDSATKASLERLGLTEADLNTAGDRLQAALTTRKGIVLGRD